eukprot:1947060-Rhodomonas_salina.3
MRHRYAGTARPTCSTNPILISIGSDRITIFKNEVAAVSLPFFCAKSPGLHGNPVDDCGGEGGGDGARSAFMYPKFPSDFLSLAAQARMHNQRQLHPLVTMLL